MNDTDLDQTCNLNASYEIIPSRENNSQSPVIETYDIVDNIIDCNQVEVEDERLENENYNEFDCNKSIFVDNDSKDENDSNEAQEENLTVIIPEELNRIDERVENGKNDSEEELEIKEKNNIELEEKKNENETDIQNKDLNLKIPNYFLPREDLEKTMKQLHFNYVNVS